MTADSIRHAADAVALALQWGLLAVFVTTLLLAVMAGVLWRRLRPTAFAVGFLAWWHALYYALFLIWPDVLGPYATMMYSIGTRYLVGFVALFTLAIAIKREAWRQ